MTPLPASVADDPARWAHRQDRWETNRPQIKTTKNHGWFTLHAQPAYEDGDREIHAVTHSGQYIGSAYTGDHPSRPGHLEGSPEVHPGHRRRGVGTAMYDFAAELHGKPMAPADSHTSHAAAFWQARTATTPAG